AVVEHGHGLKASLNGKVVYRSGQRGMALGNYVNISRHELNHLYAPSPRFDLKLEPGWNRLLLKVGSDNRKGYTDMQFCLRLLELRSVRYESKNILWMTKLPQRSNATPIIVQDRIFVMAEPDQLLCLDKNTGQILWSAALNYYEALSSAERRAKPAFRKR